MQQHVVCFVTISPAEAKKMAQALVEGKLAACVNIIPAVQSIYSWQGKICDDKESLLVIKTHAERFEALRDKIVELHSYDVAEVIAMPIVGGNPPYLRWVTENTME